jgi:hypothetical protein
MYPFITLWWRHIEMTGLWFIVWLIVFCIVCYIRSRQMNISFWDMFYALPTMISIIYFTGSYTYFLLNTGHFIPHTIIEISQIIIPPNYNFHAGWLILGIIISLIVYIYQKPSGIIRKKWIDCLFISYMNGLIIFWLFLVLWDDMIWLSTTNRLWIYAMTPFSEVAKFNQVYPVGLFLSLAALLSSLYSIFILRKKWQWWWGIGWFWVFFIMIGFILIFQNYPRHGVLQIGWSLIDINQYITRSVWILFILWHIWITKKQKNPIVRIWL